jgi:hypothetical protein
MRFRRSVSIAALLGLCLAAAAAGGAEAAPVKAAKAVTLGLSSSAPAPPPASVPIRNLPPAAKAPGDPVTLALDDGTRDNGIGLGGTIEMIWVNRFTPAAATFPFSIDTVQVYFSSTDLVTVGDDIRIVLWENTSGNTDPAVGSAFLASADFTVQTLDAWNTYTLPTPVTFDGPGDVVIGVIGLELPGTSYWPAAIDQTTTQARSWAGWWNASPPPDPATLPPPNWTLIDAYFPGNWMLRASGYEAGAAVPTHLGFVQQPTDVASGAAIAPAVTVQLLDASEVAVAQAGVSVTVALSSGTGALSGTTTQATDAAGLATFADLSLDLVGTKQLTASSAPLVDAVSASFVVSAGAPAAVTTTAGSPQVALVNTAFAQALAVTVTDAAGNLVGGASVTFTAPASGASGLFSGSGATVTVATNAGGVATAPTFTANATAGAYSVSATAPGAASAASFALTNLAADAQVPVLSGPGSVVLSLLVAAAGLFLLGRFRA